MKPLSLTASLALLLLVAGCSTPQLQGDRVLRLFSEPSGARVILTSADGPALWTGETPADVPLKCAVGRYELLLTKDGYYPTGTSIDGTIGGWFYGNFTTGSPGANAYIEPSFGADWSPLRSTLIWTLVPEDVKVSAHDMRALERVNNPY